MSHRIRTAARQAHRWKVLATGAALGSLLVLLAPQARAEAVTKCTVDGVTTYSDRACPEGIDQRRISLDDAPPVTVIASASQVRNARCEAAEAELHNIDTLTRRGQPRDMQAFLDARRKQMRNEQFRWGC